MIPAIVGATVAMILLVNGIDVFTSVASGGIVFCAGLLVWGLTK